MRRRHWDAGYSLVELLAVLALAAVLAGWGSVRLAVLIQGIHLAGTAQTVATALRLARGHALAQGAPVEVRADVARMIIEVRDQAGRLIDRDALARDVTVAGLPARGGFRFTGLGTTDNGTITLATPHGARQIVVNQRGRVRVS